MHPIDCWKSLITQNGPERCRTTPIRRASETDFPEMLYFPTSIEHRPETNRATTCIKLVSIRVLEKKITMDQCEETIWKIGSTRLSTARKIHAQRTRFVETLKNDENTIVFDPDFTLHDSIDYYWVACKVLLVNSALLVVCGRPESSWSGCWLSMEF